MKPIIIKNESDSNDGDNHKNKIHLSIYIYISICIQNIHKSMFHNVNTLLIYQNPKAPHQETCCILYSPYNLKFGKKSWSPWSKLYGIKCLKFADILNLYGAGSKKRDAESKTHLKNVGPLAQFR